MRYIVELEQTPDGVRGQVTRDDGTAPAPEPFSGWLGLLRLLEPDARHGTAPDGAGGPGVQDPPPLSR
ncbi:hypothetical protein [Spirillospora sp. NPDC047279]|uniref:hypothetical protein n=1 Tax=Spirillospora sp. NPDC047279 TaxID=3155478 RepID=UPI0033D364AA